MPWSVAECWQASTEVVALAYNVPLDQVRAPSRGRGPRPPEAVRAPRKMAVHLTALTCGADYAAIGRHIGLHKDTVSSHCAEGRERALSDQAEITSEAMEQMVRAKLTLASAGFFASPTALPNRRQLLAWELRKLSGSLAEAAQALSDEGETSSDLHPTANRKAIAA